MRQRSIDIIFDFLDDIDLDLSELHSKEIYDFCSCIFDNEISDHFMDIVKREYLPDGDLFLDYDTTLYDDEYIREAPALSLLIDKCKSIDLIYDVTIVEENDIATGLKGLRIQCKIRAGERAVYIL